MWSGSKIECGQKVKQIPEAQKMNLSNKTLWF